MRLRRSDARARHGCLAFAKLHALELAGRRLRQLLEKLDEARVLVRCQMLLHEPFQFLREVLARARICPPDRTPGGAMLSVDGRGESVVGARDYAGVAEWARSPPRDAFQAAGVSEGRSRAITIPRERIGKMSAKYSVGLIPTRWHVDRIE